MRLLKTALVLGASSLTLLVAACSGGATPAAATATATATAAGAAATTAATAAGGAATSAVTLQMMDISYSATTLTAAKGQALTITLNNGGALDHDFTIDKIDGTATVDGKDAKSGAMAVHALLKTKTGAKVVLTPTATGTYTFYCTQAGHREAGMQGTLTVK